MVFPIPFRDEPTQNSGTEPAVPHEYKRKLNIWLNKENDHAETKLAS
jgi:hypothetical protein